MDLDDHIHLRSFVKPDISPILKAIIAALLIHVILLFNWFSNSEITKVEIPQWFNVKLVAGFDIIKNKTKPPVISKKEPIEKNRVVKKSTKRVSLLKKKTTSVENKTKATTFIKADNRPYKLKNPKPNYPSAARRRGMQGMVLLSIKVNKKGFVEYIHIEKTSGFRVLDQSAVNSVSKWQFVPAKRENEFVSSVVEIPIRFQMNDT